MTFKNMKNWKIHDAHNYFTNYTKTRTKKHCPMSLPTTDRTITRFSCFCLFVFFSFLCDFCNNFSLL